MADRAAVRGYVLAGGRSSRMGEDKAELRYAGRSLLARAIATMGAACETVTVVVGDRPQETGNVGQVRDRFPNCGPIGGMEAALRDCSERGATYGAFLPVDMPLLPGGLLRALVDRWAGGTVRAAFAVVDGVAQPLVSVVHTAMLPSLERALATGSHTLQRVLRAGAEGMAAELALPVDAVLCRTEIAVQREDAPVACMQSLAWEPTPAEWEQRAGWFTNWNSPADVKAALRSYHRGEKKDGEDLVSSQIATHLKTIDERTD